MIGIGENGQLISAIKILIYYIKIFSFKYLISGGGLDAERKIFRGSVDL